MFVHNYCYNGSRRYDRSVIASLVESSLDSVFAECEKAYHRLSTEFFRGDDPVGKKLIADLESYSYLCESLIRKEHIFSINETVKDMNTGSFVGQNVT